MKRTAPVLLLAPLALAGCNEKDSDSIPRSFAAPELERAAGNLACRTQEELTERADIAVRGTEILVAATGVLGERDIAESKGQLEVLGREPIAAVRNLAGVGRLSTARTLAGRSPSWAARAAKLAQ